MSGTLNSLEEMMRETEAVVVMVDEMGIITFVNHRFEAVFGWPARDIIGQGIQTIIPPGLHEAHHLGFSRFVTTGEPRLLGQPLKLRARARDGREFLAEHYILAERKNGEWRMGATIKPLDEA